jgi:hypothetical protein
MSPLLCSSRTGAGNVDSASSLCARLLAYSVNPGLAASGTAMTGPIGKVRNHTPGPPWFYSCVEGFVFMAGSTHPCGQDSRLPNVQNKLLRMVHRITTGHGPCQVQAKVFAFCLAV